MLGYGRTTEKYFEQFDWVLVSQPHCTITEVDGLHTFIMDGMEHGEVQDQQQ